MHEVWEYKKKIYNKWMEKKNNTYFDNKTNYSSLNKFQQQERLTLLLGSDKQLW